MLYIRFIFLLMIFLCLPGNSHARQKLSLSFAGFYTADNGNFVSIARTQPLSPTLRQIHSALIPHLDPFYEVVPYGYAKSVMRQRSHYAAVGLQLFLEATLQQTQQSLQSGVSRCDYCEVRFPASPTAWGSRDRQIIVAGLESESVDGGSRIGITAVMFDGDGQFIDSQTTISNTPNMKYDALYRQMVKLIESLPLGN